ncbi:MAG TPA: globin domain-containing protein [Saprospiraceae bacterium]|nr:globin domain-containing protein [Saprospiraceae bacterium]
MTERQISLIRKSWSYFREMNPYYIGDVFYSKLFVDIPQVKHLFHTPKEIQSKKIVDMLTLIVSRLDSLEELSEEITQLALRHVNYGAQAHHYKYVCNALLWTLEQGLGKDWNKELQEAWSICLETLSEQMIKAAGYKSQRLDKR